MELLPHRLTRGETLSCRKQMPAEMGENATAAIANAGDVVVYHERVAHRSGPNSTDHWRRAVVLGWNSAGI